jgi:hypothetical protein
VNYLQELSQNLTHSERDQNWYLVSIPTNNWLAPTPYIVQRTRNHDCSRRQAAPLDRMLPPRRVTHFLVHHLPLLCRHRTRVSDDATTATLPPWTSCLPCRLHFVVSKAANCIHENRWADGGDSQAHMEIHGRGHNE